MVLGHLQERCCRCIPDFSRTQVNSDQALVVGVEDELDLVLFAIVRSWRQLDGVRSDAGMVLQGDTFLHATLSAGVVTATLAAPSLSLTKQTLSVLA